MAKEKIFISYRRGDRPLATSMLTEKLVRRYGPEYVFRDLDDIDTGENYLERIRGALMSCKVLIAIIGPDWLEQYRTALHESDDPVRFEIGTALETEGVRVLPVLLSRAKMPEKNDLPEELQELHFKNAIYIRSADLDVDIEKLYHALEKVNALRKAAERKKKESRGTLALWAVTQPESRFVLISESDKSRLEFAGCEVMLNREALDGDLSVSSERHARVEYKGGQWFITDLSSNRATFIRTNGGAVAVSDGDTLVFGDRFFGYRKTPVFVSSGKHGGGTRPLIEGGGVPEMRTQPGFTLISVADEREIVFSGDQAMVNREILGGSDASVSASAHARFDYAQDQWYVTHLDPNKESFVQIKKPEPVDNGAALIIGIKRYSFETIA